jgi:hypothetical protein
VNNPISQAEFARLVGVSKQMVGKGLKQGRVPKAFLVDVDGKVKIADVDAAKRAWLASADHSRAPGYVKERAARAEVPDPAARTSSSVVPPPAPIPRPASPRPPAAPGEDALEPPTDLSLAAESAREKFWKANLAELDFRKRSAELVEREEWIAKLADVFTRVRTRLLAIPTRTKQQLPHLAVTDIGAIDELVREGLEELTVELQAEETREAATG